MLTEEAQHLFVGETGLARIVKRTVELMKADPNGDPTTGGGIPLELIQRFINHWFSYCLDLFGAEISTNASEYFGAGLKGRWEENKRYVDHHILDSWVSLPQVVGNELVNTRFPARLAVNEQLREDYIADCEGVLRRINRVLQDTDLDFRFALPHKRFNRRQGMYAMCNFTLSGEIISDIEWNLKMEEWLPSMADHEWIETLMTHPVLEPGKMAAWIAPPSKGIRGTTIDFEYVRTESN